MDTKFDNELFKKQTGIRTFEVVQYVTGFLDGEMKDWPANIQDTLLAALEKKAQDVELPLTVVHSRCDIDHATEEGGKDRFFIHVIASEIVVADDRYLAAAKSEIKGIISDIIAGRRTQ